MSNERTGTAIETETVSASDSYTELVSATLLQSVSLKLQHSAQWDDMSVLEPLCKRNHSQHRRTDYFARVSAVLRCGNMHRQSKVAESWKLLASVIRDVSDADVPFGKTRLIVPSQETASAALAELVAEVQQCVRMAMLCMAACELLMSQVSQSFFLPFCLTAAAVISTLRISASSHLMQCISVYNSMIPLVAALPRRHSSKAGDGLCLPESLGVQWMHGLPFVVGHPFSAGDGFHQLGVRLGAQHDVAYTAYILESRSSGMRTIESDMAERARLAQHATLPIFEDMGHARTVHAHKPILFDTVPGFELGASFLSTVSRQVHQPDSVDPKTSNATACASEVTIEQKGDGAPQNLRQGSVSAGKRSKSTNWKALLLQKKATKRTGAVAIEGMPQPGHTSQKRRQLPPTAEAAADFPGACVDPQNKHVIEASKPVREADALNQNSGKKQGPDLMTLLTCGSLPE